MIAVQAECYRYGFMGREVYGLDAIDTCSWVGKCRGWVLKVLPSGVEHCALSLSFYSFIPSFFSLKRLVYLLLTPSTVMMSS